MNGKTSAKSDFELARSSNGLKAAHLSPLSTYLVLYLFFSAQVFPRSSGAQKFYPNGRYGRRSDLPPLMKVPSLVSNMDSSLLSQDIPAGKDALPSSFMNSNAVEEYYSPMWCAEIDRKLNLFKCFDRFPMKLLRQSQGKLVDIGSAATQVQPSPVDQDQQS